jgi:polyisoprenoid-binding protein YceI
MLWSKRRNRQRRTDPGARHALVPMPLTGGMVSGDVRDDRGKPIVGAEISIFESSSKRVAHTETDAYGMFVVALVPGNYRIHIQAGGYETKLDRIEIGWGEHLAMGQLRLVPDETLATPLPGIWTIDPSHSAVRFVARHLALSRVYGQFLEFQGQIRIAERFEDSHVEVLIEAASIYTNAEKRDEHLRSADVLDVERYPKLRFTSHRFSRAGGNKWLIDGELTLHGMTADVQLDTTYLGMQEWYGVRAGCIATTELHREHFTVNWQYMLANGVPVVGSTIQIQLDVQATLPGGKIDWSQG